MMMLTVVAVLLCAPAVPARMTAAPKEQPDAIHSLMVSDQKFAQRSDAANKAGISNAPLWGDGNSGAFGEMVKFPAGTTGEQHKHTAAFRSVVLSGTFLLGTDADSMKEYSTGSYAMVPAGVLHASGCKAGKECTVLQFYDGKYDSIPTKPVTALK